MLIAGFVGLSFLGWRWVAEGAAAAHRWLPRPEIASITTRRVLDYASCSRGAGMHAGALRQQENAERP